MARQDGLRCALEVIGGHLLAQLHLHRVDLPAFVVGQVRGGDAPAGARVAELAHDNGASDAVHLDASLPHVAPVQQGGDVVLGQDGDAEEVYFEADVFRESGSQRDFDRTSQAGTGPRPSADEPKTARVQPM